MEMDRLREDGEGAMIRSTTYDVWWQDAEAGEQPMEDNHRPFWDKVIALIAEPDLREASVLDFGCNQGGFLRTLYDRRPFARAVGVDLAHRSVEIANERRGERPISYVVTPALDAYRHEFDLAISTAVVYLLPDLADHARQIRHALKPGGVYYASYTDYAGNPSLPRLREGINRHAAVPMQEHTLDAIAEAFHGEGFSVALRRMVPEGFVALSWPDRFFARIADRMLYEYTQAYLFRFVAAA
jgi:SAM-dependent methyltransferase